MVRSERFDIITPADYAEQALAMRTVGWLLLIHDVLVNGLFVFQGLRDGSLVWLLWTLSQGFLGLLLVGMGVSRRTKATLAQGLFAPESAPAVCVPRTTIVNEPPRAA